MFYEKESVECQYFYDPPSSNEKTELAVRTAVLWRIFT
jgi:hypothetical protein